MKVLIAGATGVLGRQLVPKLVAAGHEVAGTTRTPSKEPALREAGAAPFVLDLLDPEAVARAVAAFEPTVLVHEATALSSVDMRHFDRAFALTNQLRTEGIDHLLAGRGWRDSRRRLHRQPRQASPHRHRRIDARRPGQRSGPRIQLSVYDPGSASSSARSRYRQRRASTRISFAASCASAVPMRWIWTDAWATLLS